MSRLAAMLVGLLLASGFSLTQEPKSIAPVTCYDDGQRKLTAEEFEARCLAALGKLAVRKGDVLQLRLENGQIKSFKHDQSGCEAPNFNFDKCISYYLAAYLPAQRMFVVALHLYEGSGFTLVSARTGKTAGIGTPPIFSPSGKRIVSVDQDEAYGTYNIAIFSTDVDPARLEWQYNTPAGDPFEQWEFLAWEGDDKIRFSVKVSLAQNEWDLFEAQAVITPQGWQLKRPWVTR